MNRRELLVSAAGGLLHLACHGEAALPGVFVVVPPGTHPGIVFSASELPMLRTRARTQGMAGDAYRKVRQLAFSDTPLDLSIRATISKEGPAASGRLECLALVYQIEEDEATGRKGVELFQSAATGIDPWEYYRAVDSDFFATEHWPKAFALAWDWLFPILSPDERQSILASLEQWCAALFAHTESWWWSDATYNCGAIPVGAQGILMSAIQAETRHPEFRHWFDTCFRKIRDGYFPTTWRANGICNEGPGYAHYHKNPTQFAEAVRRTGGPDIVPQSGAVNAMHYLRHQWMPQGGCAPVGDNTNYGRRVFQSIYLHGIRELRDQAGLWTFENFTDTSKINPLPLFLFYPDGLEPISPGELDLRTSFYFELDPNRAGYVFSRSEWDSDQASFFAFTTRYVGSNHTHFDMNSFLFSAFGEQFATHDNVYGYQHEHHGADFEHNIVVIDGGGMPAADAPNSAGDDGSILGLMTGVGLGHFGDYVRGDARLSYADPTVASTKPAKRADRSVLFVKQGPNPYVVVADDIQKDETAHDYHWQWYTPALSIAGAGTFGEPFLIDGRQAGCRLAFLDPATPSHDFSVVSGGSPRTPIDLGLLRVNVRAVRTRFFAVAAASRHGAPEPVLRPGPEIADHSTAASLLVEGDGFRDWVVWQPEEVPDRRGLPLTAGRLKTDALMAVVRTNLAGGITDYIMGDGAFLEFDGHTLVRSEQLLSVNADAKRTVATGPRRARSGEPPLAPTGSFWLPSSDSEVWVAEERIEAAVETNRVVSLPRV